MTNDYPNGLEFDIHFKLESTYEVKDYEEGRKNEIIDTEFIKRPWKRCQKRKSMRMNYIGIDIESRNESSQGEA